MERAPPPLKESYLSTEANTHVSVLFLKLQIKENSNKQAEEYIFQSPSKRLRLLMGDCSPEKWSTGYLQFLTNCLLLSFLSKFHKIKSASLH